MPHDRMFPEWKHLMYRHGITRSPSCGFFLFLSAALHRRKGKAMKTPIDFDYDLWVSENGKAMVRVKRTGETCEVNQATMRLLRSEEKKLRRSQAGVPVSGSHGEVKMPLLSLDFVSVQEAEEMSPAWLDDHSDIENDVIVKNLEREFRASLTDVQREIYVACLLNGLSYTEFAARKGVSYQSIQQAVLLIRKKAKKYFK